MGSPLPPDPYVALGVPKDATPAAIKVAYRKLALKTHLDKFPDPVLKAERQAQFFKIQQAYEIIGDADKREQHDAQVRLVELRKEAMERQQRRFTSTKLAEFRAAVAGTRTTFDRVHQLFILDGPPRVKKKIIILTAGPAGRRTMIRSSATEGDG